MSTRRWRHARATSLVLLTGCGGGPPPERLYDIPIDCRPEGAPVFPTVDEAIAVLDANGDGALTDTDVGPGETSLVLALTGTHTTTGQTSDPGFSLHTDWAAEMFPYPQDFASWGVQFATNCTPMMNVFVNFIDDTLPSGTLVAGDYEGRGIGIDVVVLETHAADGAMDAIIRVTGAEGGRASGYMIGSGRSALIGLAPEEALTGQWLSVEAFAFREIVKEAD